MRKMLADKPMKPHWTVVVPTYEPIVSDDVTFCPISRVFWRGGRHLPLHLLGLNGVPLDC